MTGHIEVFETTSGRYLATYKDESTDIPQHFAHESSSRTQAAHELTEILKSRHGIHGIATPEVLNCSSCNKPKRKTPKLFKLGKNTETYICAECVAMAMLSLLEDGWGRKKPWTPDLEITLFKEIEDQIKLRDPNNFVYECPQTVSVPPATETQLH